MKSESEVAQSCPSLCDPIDCSLPGSTIHGIFQARILEWVGISFSRRSSRPRDWTWVSRIVGRRFTIWATREVPSKSEAQLCPTLCDPIDYPVHGILQARILEWVVFPFSRGSPQPSDWTQVSCITGRFFTGWAIREAQIVGLKIHVSIFVVGQSLSHVWCFVTPWTAACQASLSFTIYQRLLTLMPLESVMPSNYLILCCPLLLPSLIFPSIWVFSNESVLRIRWPKYWSQLLHQSFQWIFRIEFIWDWLVWSPCSLRV